MQIHKRKYKVMIPRIHQAELEESIAKLGYDIEIYHTKAVRDGERFVRQYIKEHGPVRFIACGVFFV